MAEKRDAILCVPGLNWDPKTSAVDVLARRFVAALERNAPAKDKFKTSEGKELNFRNSKRSARVITVERMDTQGAYSPVLDLYELNYHKELVDRFTSRSFLSQSASLVLQLIALIPPLWRARKSPAKRWTERGRVFCGWFLMAVLMVYLAVIMATGLSTFLAALPATKSTADVRSQSNRAEKVPGDTPSTTKPTERQRPELKPTQNSSESKNAESSAPEKSSDEPKKSDGSAVEDDRNKKKGEGISSEDNGGKKADKKTTKPVDSNESVAPQTPSLPVTSLKERLSFWASSSYSYWNEKIVPTLQKIIVFITAIGIFFQKSLKDFITAVASRTYSAIDYLRLGVSKREVLGQFTSLLDFIGEQGLNDRIHVLSYSFGTIVAMDAVFPENQPAGQIGTIDTLITIGSPFDIVRAYWPNYEVVPAVVEKLAAR